MNTNVYIAVVILVCAVCTFSERLFPFLIFGKHKVPRVVRYLGKVLPMAIMMALVVYCLRLLNKISAAQRLSGWNGQKCCVGDSNGVPGPLLQTMRCTSCQYLLR